MSTFIKSTTVQLLRGTISRVLTLLNTAASSIEPSAGWLLPRWRDNTFGIRSASRRDCEVPEPEPCLSEGILLDLVFFLSTFIGAYLAR